MIRSGWFALALVLTIEGVYFYDSYFRVQSPRNLNLMWWLLAIPVAALVFFPSRKRAAGFVLASVLTYPLLTTLGYSLYFREVNELSLRIVPALAMAFTILVAPGVALGIAARTARFFVTKRGPRHDPHD